MVNKKCELCENSNLILSDVIPGLCYCVKCDNFFYYGENRSYPIKDVLKAIAHIFPDLIIHYRSLGLLADLCTFEDNFLDIYANVISSNILEIDTIKSELQSEDINDLLLSYSHILEQTLKIDYEYCEYTIKLIIYALGFSVRVEEPCQSDYKTESNIIKTFKASTNKVLRGKSVEITWDVRLKQAIIKLQVGKKIYGIKNPRYSKKISILEDTTVTLIVENRKSHHEMARRQLFVSVIDPVEIIEFVPSSYISLESLPIQLRWSVKNANKIVLLPSQQDVTNTSVITVYPVESVTYSLKVSNECSSAESNLSISVKKIPSISHVDIPGSTTNFNCNVHVQLPHIKVILSPLNFSLRCLKWQAEVSSLVPHITSNKHEPILNMSLDIPERVKSLFVYFEKLKKQHEK